MQEIVYNLSQPYHLFSSLYGLVLRDRKLPIKVLNDEFSEKHTTIIPNANKDYLFTLMVKPEDPNAPYYRFIDTEGVLEEYVLSISNKIDTLKESEICNYFYYLGKLLGQFAFMLSFKKNIYLTESHLKERFSKTKSSIIIMMSSFSQMAQKMQEYLASDEKSEDYTEILQKSKVFLEPSNEFNDILDSIDVFTDSFESEVPISTVFAIGYIGLSYLLFGMLPRLINPNSISMKDFFNKCSSGGIADTLNNLVINNEEEGIINKYKVYALLYTFKKITNFYLNDNTFRNNMAKNISISALYNIGEFIEKYCNDEKETEGKDIIVEIAVNTIFGLLPNVETFTDMTHWIEPELSTFGLASDCDNPIVYFKTLNLFLANSYTTNSERFHSSVFQNMYEMLNLQPYETNTISFKSLKLLIEKMILEDTKLISPKNIFKLLYIAGFARQYFYGTNISVKRQHTEDEKIAYDVVVIAETAVYNMIQEWFNRKTKLYNYEPRVYTFPEAYQANLYKQLKYECFVSLFEYMRLVFDGSNTYKTLISSLNTTDLVRSLHYDMMSLQTTFTPENVINSVSFNLETLDDSNYAIDKMVQLENSKIGIIYLLLRYPERDMINEIITLHLPLTEFFTQFESNTDEAAEMRDYILSLKPKTDILGTQSDTYIYKIVNTNNREILNSSLNNIQKFYLSYCLNYQFIKSYQAEMFATTKSMNEVIINDKEKLLDEDRQITSSLESQYKLIFGNLHTHKTEKYGKYGLPL